MSKAYVHNGVEVKLTGKVAQKKLRSGKIDELHEITPRHAENGTFKKWVRMVDLFEIVEEPAPQPPLQLIKDKK